MKKIRIGNDFVFAWEIERNGLPEDLSSVLEKHLYLSVLGKRVELVDGVDYDITGNVVRIEITPTIANILGTYKAEFHYILPDIGLIDEDRKCAVDVDAFAIVSSTAQADDPSEFTVTSDMAIAFKGDKGDPFTYDDFTPDQIEELQRPATEAAASIEALETTISQNEQVRVTAESSRDSAEQTRASAELARVSAEESRGENEGVRVSNELGRVNAENDRVDAEEEREQKVSELWENITELTELPSFDITKKQRVVHEFGVLKWEDYE